MDAHATTLPLLEVDGYWLDTEESFEGYLIKQTHDCNEEEEDSIFYYGLSESQVIDCLGKQTAEEFVITAYRVSEIIED